MAGKREKSSSPLNKPITYDTARRSLLEKRTIGLERQKQEFVEKNFELNLNKILNNGTF